MTHNSFEQLILLQIEKDPQNLMMLPSQFWPKHHEGLSHKFYDPKRDVMNHRYFASDVFKSNILKIPLTTYNLKAVFTKQEKWESLKSNPLAILQFDLEECSNVMIDYALNAEPRLLSVMDQSIQTEERVRSALNKDGLVLGFIKDEFKTYKNCKIAVKQNIYAIQYVPEDLLDEYFEDIVVASAEWLLKLLPRKFAIRDKIQDAYFEKDVVRSLVEYLEVYALEDDREVVYSYLNIIRKKDLDRDVFKTLTSSFYLSNGFNIPLIHFMLNDDVSIINFFDFEQLDQVHFKNAIQGGFLFDRLPTDVWKFILPSLVEFKTEQLFFLPESLKGMITPFHEEVLQYCLSKKKEGTEFSIPNFLFNEVAYKGTIDEKVIEYADLRVVCDVLINGKTKKVEDLEKINSNNSTIFEIKLLQEKVDQSIIENLFKKDPIWYPLLTNKTLENSVAFATTYPNAYYEINSETIKDEEFIKQVNITTPEFFDF